VVPFIACVLFPAGGAAAGGAPPPPAAASFAGAGTKLDKLLETIQGERNAYLRSVGQLNLACCSTGYGCALNRFSGTLSCFDKVKDLLRGIWVDDHDLSFLTVRTRGTSQC
jgi:hypothetical protein